MAYTKPVYNMKKQSKVGDQGIKELLDKYPGSFKKDECEGWDVLYTDGFMTVTVEVKTDTYYFKWNLNPDIPFFRKTENLFIEKFTETRKTGYRKIGGPWRAAQHNADIFLYYFKNEKVFYWFDDIPALINTVEQWLTRYPNPEDELIEIDNGWYFGLGWKVPISVVDHLATKVPMGGNIPALKRS